MIALVIGKRPQIFIDERFNLIRRDENQQIISEIYYDDKDVSIFILID